MDVSCEFSGCLLGTLEARSSVISTCNGERIGNGSSCTARCNDGHTLMGMTSKCLAGRVISEPECVPNGCTDVVAPVHGSLGTCLSSLEHGSSCEFTCDDGYEIDPGASRQTMCVFGQLHAPTCAPTNCTILLPRNSRSGTCELIHDSPRHVRVKHNSS
eukprot:SAG31_NODE_24139_length_488_cov_1.053985_1_plen_158_part_10